MDYFQRVKDMREDKDLNQSDIAKLLNTSQQQYSLYERGIRKLNAEQIIILCKFYNVSADFLLGITNEFKKLHKKSRKK
ncbi:MAG: helix-turn-helix domain-containing protein [Clostridiales bacterium]|nr:helix-turn-helix domain-containing protein [Clostridiales bacterium]